MTIVFAAIADIIIPYQHIKRV